MNGVMTRKRSNDQERGNRPQFWQVVWRAFVLLSLANVPQARTGSLGLEERFASDPAMRGWTIFGEPKLFRWNATNQNLEVTWDSRQTNSFFYRSLGTVLAKSDDFSFSFDLQLDEIAIGIKPAQPFTFQLAAGLMNLRVATSRGFVRGTGSQSPNLVEFNYFPDSGFGATVSPILVSSNNQFIPSFSFPLELTPTDQFHIAISYSAFNQVLRTQMTRNREPFGPIKDVKLPATFTDFRVDTIAVMSYSDAKADGSLLARGVIDNVIFESSATALSIAGAQIVNQRWQVEIFGRTNWIYSLERTEDLATWQSITPSTPGTGASHVLREEGIARPRGFYRIRAERP